MLLTHYYSRVAASQDYSGWITPEGKFLRHIGSHANTLRINKVEVDADDALNEGFIWLLDSSDSFYVECNNETFPFAKQEVEKLVGDDERIDYVHFDVFYKGTDSGKSSTFRFDRDHVRLIRIR